MNVKRFIARTSREALRLVKESLGPDAVILSNAPGADGVEILAAPAADMSALVSASAAHPKAAVANPAQRTDASATNPAPSTSADPLGPQLTEELRFMRGLLEQQMASLVWSELGRRNPLRVGAVRELLAAGLSPALARQLVNAVPEHDAASNPLRWIKNIVARSVPIAQENIIEKGGVYALVGPTGVGKTTTTAKLAARCVVRHGAEKLALLTTDGYRIGGHEQLRIYGKILGVPVYATREKSDLRTVLSELRGKHLVLIDTVGMSQRDRMVAEQIAMLREQQVNRLLLLNATCSADTLEDVFLAYKEGGLAGCIITKIDEAPSAGAVVDIVIRRRVPLHFVANGQRVPEDLHAPSAAYLADRALRPARRSADFALKDMEYALLMGTEAFRLSGGPGVAEVRLG